MAEELGPHPVPNLSSSWLRPNLSLVIYLYSTALTDLNRHILGVCDPPKDKVVVASIAVSKISLYVATFVPLSENL